MWTRQLRSVRFLLSGHPFICAWRDGIYLLRSLLRPETVSGTLNACQRQEYFDECQELQNYRICYVGGGGVFGVERKCRIICVDLDLWSSKNLEHFLSEVNLNCNNKYLFVPSSSPLLPSPSKTQVSSLAPYSRKPSASLTPMSSNRNIVVLYTLIFTFSDSTRADRTFWTEC
jgi:hypothetical protein